MESLGHHLGTDQDIHLMVAHLLENGHIFFAVCCGIAVQPGNPGMGNQLANLCLDTFRTNAQPDNGI